MTWALVTGASSGFGRDFARLLSKEKYNLVLVARRTDRLVELKKELEQNSDRNIEIISKDLSLDNAPDEIFNELQAKNIHIDILINNAGCGVNAPFLEADQNRIQNMIDLDVKSLTKMAYLFARPMVENHHGKILNIASIAAYMPCPNYACYGASKAYVLNFSDCLRFELKGTGVSVTTLCPGTARTEFNKLAGERTNLYIKMASMSSMEVAKAGLDGLFNEKKIIVPGIINKLNTYVLRILPRGLWPEFIELFTKKKNKSTT